MSSCPQHSASVFKGPKMMSLTREEMGEGWVTKLEDDE